MINISIVATKARVRPDPWAPLELENTGLVKHAGKALLSDKQNSLLGQFIVTHISPNDHDKFRSAVLSKLAAGRPGDGALRQSMRLTAEAFGFTTVELSAVGLTFHDRAESSRRAGIDKPRMRIKRGKYD